MVAVYNRTGRIITARPNWQRAVEVEYEFKTAIITSEDGTEHRDALRGNARVNVSYETMLTSVGVQRHLADMTESLNSPFVVPVSWRRAVLAAPSPFGVAVLSVEAFWIEPGARLVLRNGLVEEAVEVAAVGGGTVTLAAPLVNSFPPGAAVYLAYTARLPMDPEFRAETPMLWTGQVRVAVVPGSDPQAAIEDTPDMFEGREVFLTKPNWNDLPRISLEEQRQEFDPGRGTTFVESATRRLNMQQNLGFSAFDRTASEKLLAFFLRMKGKRGAFWMPTRQADFSILAATGTTFDLPGEDAYYGFRYSTVFKVVMARWRDGSYQINRVTGLSLVGANTRLTFANAWTAPIPGALGVHWCPLWRFATDQITMRWTTGTVADSEFTFVTLPSEEPV